MVVVKNIEVTVTVKNLRPIYMCFNALKRSYDIQLHYAFMTFINYACVRVKRPNTVHVTKQ